MALLTQTEIQQQLQTLQNWSLKNQQICCVKTFVGFPEAILFVQSLVDPAEKAGHHPDLEISYNRVKISLTTHDQGGLTQKDFDLARTIDRLP